MRVPAAIRSALSLLAVTAGLSSCTGDGSTLDLLGAPLGPPRVVLAPLRVDLSLIEGTDRVVEITISNSGGLPLRVDDVTSPSSFIVPVFGGPREIRAGEAVTVGATISAVSALVSPQVGTIDVASNDPESGVASVPVQLIVTAGPLPEIGVEPDSLAVRVALRGVPRRRP